MSAIEVMRDQAAWALCALADLMLKSRGIGEIRMGGERRKGIHLGREGEVK